MRLFSRIGRTGVKKTAGLAASLLAAALIFLFLMEVGLRIAPSLVPDRLLADFHQVPRAEIAGRRGLPTLSQTVLIGRDDNGPELRVPKPFTKRNWPDIEPGTVDSTQVDDMGFCNPPENSYGRPEIEVISLGDSFIWCTAIDPKDTWTGRLASLGGYSAYNLAAIGIGLHEHLQILKRFGIEKSPRFVIMNVYEGNDLQDAATYLSHIAGPAKNGDGPGAPSTRPTTLPFDPCLVFHGPRQGLIGHYSYASNMLLVLAQNSCDGASRALTPDSVFPARPEDTETDFRYRVEYPELTVDYNVKNVGSGEVLYAHRLRSQEVDLEIFSGPLTSFVELSREHGFVPIVTYTPSAYTTYSENVVFDDGALTSLMPWFSGRQREYFQGQAETIGYEFLDLTPFLRSAAVPTQKIEDLLYFRSNMHLTQRGHEVVAETISRALELLVNGRSLQDLGPQS